MTDTEFRAIQELAYQSCGLQLMPEKRGLVASRLRSVTRRIGVDTFSDYYRYLRADDSGGALVEFIDTLTTNHTSFLRDAEHFDLLVPSLSRARARSAPLRVWSAACSTGEEPFTAAMTLLDAAPFASVEWSILATDISSRALNVARRAAYALSRIENLPANWTNTYFERGREEWTGWVRVRREVRDRVRFERFNLLDPFEFPHLFDLIFCRNVMIYFDRETRESLVKRMAQRLSPDGYFLIGGSESLRDLDAPLRIVSPGVYTHV